MSYTQMSEDPDIIINQSVDLDIDRHLWNAPQRSWSVFMTVVWVLTIVQTVLLLTIIVFLATAAPAVHQTMQDVQIMMPEMKKSLTELGQMMPEIKEGMGCLHTICHDEAV
jgi:hypothetical protein